MALFSFLKKGKKDSSKESEAKPSKKGLFSKFSKGGKKPKKTDPKMSKKPKKVKLNKKAVVGIDFQDNSIRVVQMTKRKKEMILERAAFIPMDASVWKMGRIQDQEKFFEILKKGLEDAGINGQKVVVGLSGTNSVVRVVRLPRLTKAQLRETVNVQLGQYVPFPPEDTLFKYEVLRDILEDEIEKQEVMIVATRYSILDPILLALQKLNMDPVGVKVGFLSATSVLSRYFEDYSQSVAIVDLRNAITDILFVSGSNDDLDLDVEAGKKKKKKKKAVPLTPGRLSRTIEFGYEKVIRDFAGQLPDGVSVQDLPEIFRMTDIDLLDSSSSETGEDSVDDDPFASFGNEETQEEEVDEDSNLPSSADVNIALRKVFDNFASDIDSSKRYFESWSRSRERLGRVVLIGNIRRFNNIDAYLSEKSGLDVVLGDPLENIDYGSTEWFPDKMRGAVYEIATAVSLASEAL
tara:strand:- start:2099 stop:3490 length:1392 start_codon:yes stop_codon:yes gene_type:complete